MKKNILLTALFCILGCSENEITNGSTDSFISTITSESQDITRQQDSTQNDTLFPYFEFNRDGSRINFNKAENSFAMKKKNRDVLELNTIEDFVDLETEYSKKIKSDKSFSHSIERPLDYACPPSLLALNEQYSLIKTAKGDTLLNDKILLDNCIYIGFDCDTCDEAAEQDPYLSKSKILKKEVKEQTSFKSIDTVEIYPYKMIASSFKTNLIAYASAGAETYFKKRQRVWRGTSGMVWRWASFDPDRNDVRSYCFDACGVTEYSNQLACTDPESNSDLDTWGDTEYIGERCDISFAVSLSGGVGDNLTFYDVHMLPTYENVKEFKGGVVGMHYVRHNDYYFKARTSKGFSTEVRWLLNTYPNFNYK